MSDKKIKAQKNKIKKANTLAGIQKMSFRFQAILITTLALFLGFSGTFINLQFETNRRDRNLQNVAEAIAKTPFLTEKDYSDDVYYTVFSEYLDSLKDTLEDIDVISVIGIDG